MRINSKRTLIVSGAVGLAIAGAGISQAIGSGDKSASAGDPADGSATDRGESSSIAGPDLARASKAALRYTGGGTVTDTELRDEEGYYEIEVGKEGGGQVDVHLDRNFNLIDSSSDGG